MLTNTTTYYGEYLTHTPDSITLYDFTLNYSRQFYITPNTLIYPDPLTSTHSPKPHQLIKLETCPDSGNLLQIHFLFNFKTAPDHVKLHQKNLLTNSTKLPPKQYTPESIARALAHIHKTYILKEE